MPRPQLIQRIRSVYMGLLESQYPPAIQGRVDALRQSVSEVKHRRTDNRNPPARPSGPQNTSTGALPAGNQKLAGPM